MRHIVVHLIRGEAGAAHEEITKQLTQEFDCFPLHDRIPPHLTLKRRFELDEAGMDSVYMALDDFANSHRQTGYALKGYGHFGTDVIYVDVAPSQELRDDLQDLYTALHAIPELTFDQFDDEGSELHATVAMAAHKPFDYDQVWSHLQQGPVPNFDMKFDNIAVLKKEGEKWVVERVWEIPV